MVNPSEYADRIHDQFLVTCSLATDRALLVTIEAIANAARVTTLAGLSVSEFFQARKSEYTEALIADFADVDPTMASQVKALWERYAEEDARQCR